jgi:hypothetical protein
LLLRITTLGGILLTPLSMEEQMLLEQWLVLVGTEIYTVKGMGPPPLL